MKKINKKIKKVLKAIFCVPNKPYGLPMIDFGARPEDYTWEDWAKDSKNMYPVRYFLSETIPDYFRPFKTRVEDGIWYLKCHFLPKYRYHIINLSNPGGGFDYSYGCIDADQKIVMCFGRLICDFVEKELSKRHNALETYELKEINELYHWWKVDRPKMIRDYDNRVMNLDISNQNLFDSENEINKLDTEMMIKFINVRHLMWT